MLGLGGLGGEGGWERDRERRGGEKGRGDGLVFRWIVFTEYYILRY